jgi:hypothetical protein
MYQPSTGGGTDLNPVEFLKPRLIGERFNGHAIPLEVLKDLAVLEEMIVEVAKWKYLSEHPDRKRTPRGFTDGIQLKLTGIEDGSARAVISLFVASPLLFPLESQQCFESARDAIVDAVAAAERQADVTEHLPEKALIYFDRIGRSLRDGEICELATPGRTNVGRLTRDTRRTLVFASKSTELLSEEAEVRGAVPAADQDKKSFEIRLFDGRKVKASYGPQHAESVLEAFSGYESGTRALVQGIGRFNRNRKLQDFEVVEHVTVLDALDVASRIDELRQLGDGWLDGHGRAPLGAHLDWFAAAFESHFANDLPLPHVYPTESGDLQAEWTLGAVDITLEVDLVSRNAHWHALDLKADRAEERDWDLGSDQAWEELAAALRQYQPEHNA